jgi:Nucleotidyltransferase of unknown function (DUF6036)
MPDTEEPLEPWRSFFGELDSCLTEEVQLHCCGGFVITNLYGVARDTSDIDFLSIVPNVWRNLAEIAGQGSGLHRKHKRYLHPITIVTPPENYEERLVLMFPGAWRHLHLFGLEAHDLALTKLEANRERDRDDVQRLARAGHLKAEILKGRYYDDLRPNLLAHEDRHDLTLALWLELISAIQLDQPLR